MSLEILISAGTGVLGVIVGNFKEEIKNFFVSSKEHQYLKGKWHCSWDERPTKKFPAGKTFFDTLEISSIHGKLVDGSGDSKSAGHWEFQGKVTDNTLTLIYKVKEGSDKSGTIILERNLDDKDTMKGFWIQYRQGEIVNGTTKWEKSR